MATEHLIERGCKNILSISSFTANYPGNERQMGYERALAAHGMPLCRDYQLFVSGKQPSIIESEELVTDFLSTGCPVDGIFAHSDHAAVGALRALVAAGKRVPEDVRLIGFDDSVYAQIPTPQISTIRRFPERSRTRDVRPCSPCCAARNPRWRRLSLSSSCSARAVRPRMVNGPNVMLSLSPEGVGFQNSAVSDGLGTTR